MTDNFYDDIYYGGKKTSSNRPGEGLSAKEREVSFLNHVFRPEGGTALIDLGCGMGDYLGSLKNGGIDTWGIDISEVATARARTKVQKPEQIICANAEQLPFDDEKFDYVTAWGVIEHFPDINVIIREVARVLKKQGTAVVMVPNMYYYKFVWDALRAGAGPVKHQEIEWLCAFQEWKQYLECNGLRVVRCERHNKFNKSGIMQWIKTTIPFYFSNHFIFFTEK